MVQLIHTTQQKHLEISTYKKFQYVILQYVILHQYVICKNLPHVKIIPQTNHQSYG